MENYKKQEIEYEDAVAANYDDWYNQSLIENFYNKDFANYLKKYIKPKDRVLDLGCGPATLWPDLIKVKNISLIGVDISPKMVSIAKKKYPKGKFKTADIEKLPFKDKEFDIVICSSVLHHLKEPLLAFQEIKRVLSPQGLLIGREPQLNPFITRTDPWISGAVMALVNMVKRREKITDQTEPAIHEFHHAFEINKFVQELNNNFTVKDIKTKYPFSSLFAKTKKVLAAKIILKTDLLLENYAGNQFFFLAQKEAPDSGQILSYIQTYLKNQEKNSAKIPLAFVKRLIWLTAIFDLILPKK